jgi:uncharacterized membrane protein YfcA
MTIATAAPYLLLIGLISIAAIVNGMVGFGFALLAVNALALVLDAKSGVIVMSLLAPMMSGLQLWHHRSHLHLERRLWSMIGAALLGSIVGTQLLVLLPSPAVSLALGLFTIYFVLSSLRRERPPMAHTTQRWLGPVAGAIGGITNGALGASGPVFGTYLTAIGLRGREFAVAISAAFFTMGLLRVGLLIGFQQYTVPLVGLALLLAVPAVLVQRVGFHLQGRLDRTTVYRAVLVVLAVGGINLTIRGLLGLW